MASEEFQCQLECNNWSEVDWIRQHPALWTFGGAIWWVLLRLGPGLLTAGHLIALELINTKILHWTSWFWPWWGCSVDDLCISWEFNFCWQTQYRISQQTYLYCLQFTLISHRCPTMSNQIKVSQVNNTACGGRLANVPIDDNQLILWVIRARNYVVIMLTVCYCGRAGGAVWIILKLVWFIPSHLSINISGKLWQMSACWFSARPPNHSNSNRITELLCAGQVRGFDDSIEFASWANAKILSCGQWQLFSPPEIAMRD